MKSILIDTNIYSLALRGDKDIIPTLRKSDEIGFSVISIGELFADFKGSKRENIEELEEFLDSPRVVVYVLDDSTCQFYASVLFNLKKIWYANPNKRYLDCGSRFSTWINTFYKR